MYVLAWITLGLVAAVIATRLLAKSDGGFLVELVLGIGGALLGGALFQTFGITGFAGVNIWSLFLAAVGSAMVITTFHILAQMRGSHG